MRLVAPIVITAALAASAAAQDYRVDVFGASVADRNQLFGGSSFAATSEMFYGISVDRLDVFTPGLDIGLGYNVMQHNDPGFATFVSGDSVFVTASYGMDVYDSLKVYGTAGLGATFAYSQGRVLGAFKDTVASGFVGLGARYSYDALSLFAEYRSQSAH